jgi:hypothetical protein
MWTSMDKKGQARILAVWGSPGGGKTTLAARLALESESRKINTVLLFCDNIAPELPVLLPHSDKNDIRLSLGALLDSSVGGGEGSKVVDDSMSLSGSLSYVACLGYIHGENVLSYPLPTALQAEAALSAVARICDVIIVSIPSDFPRSAIAMLAAEKSDMSVCVISPNIKSLSYLASNKALYPPHKGRSVMVLNHPSEADTVAAGSLLPNIVIDADLPYSDEISMKQREGKLLDMAGRTANEQEYQSVAADIYSSFEETQEITEETKDEEK